MNIFDKIKNINMLDCLKNNEKIILFKVYQKFQKIVILDELFLKLYDINNWNKFEKYNWNIKNNYDIKYLCLIDRNNIILNKKNIKIYFFNFKSNKSNNKIKAIENFKFMKYNNKYNFFYVVDKFIDIYFITKSIDKQNVNINKLYSIINHYSVNNLKLILHPNLDILYIVSSKKNENNKFKFSIKGFSNFNLLVGYVFKINFFHNYLIKKLKVNNDFSFFIFLNEKNELNFYSMIENCYMNKFNKYFHNQKIYDFQYSSTGMFLYIRNEDNNIKIFDLKHNFKLIKIIKIEENLFTQNKILLLENDYTLLLNSGEKTLLKYKKN